MGNCSPAGYSTDTSRAESCQTLVLNYLFKLAGGTFNVQNYCKLRQLFLLQITLTKCCYKLRQVFLLQITTKLLQIIAPCKGIRIPESTNFLPLESGILGFGVRNPALRIRNPTKDWNPESNLLKIHSRLN